MKVNLNTEKYIIFSVPIRQELNNGKTTTYKLKFTFRFKLTLLSKLVDNLSEIYGNKKCRDKNCKSECEFKGLKNNKLSYNCKECRKKQLKPINGLLNLINNWLDIDKMYLYAKDPYEKEKSILD